MSPTTTKLRSSNYMKLLEYAADRLGTPFTEQDATVTTSVSPQVFKGYVGIIYSETTLGNGQYGITADTIPKYIDFLEFQEAKASALSAKKEAELARKLALCAILISAVLALTQVYFQVEGVTRLETKQLTALVESSTSIKDAIDKRQSLKFDALGTKLDEVNNNLQELNKKQIDLLEKIKPGQRAAP